MLALENDLLQFHIEPERAAWSLSSNQPGSLSLQNVEMQAFYRIGRTRSHALHEWLSPRISTQEGIPSPQGPLRVLQVSLGPDQYGLCFTLTFALPELHPLFLWRLSVENTGAQAVFIDRLELFRLGGKSPGIIFPSPARGLAFFSNGWQSWSWCGAYGFNDRARRTRLGPLRAPTDINQGTSQPKSTGHFASDMFAVLGDRHLRTGVVAGFLSQQQHFGSLDARLDPSHPSLRLWANGDGARLDPGASMESDWACIQYLGLDDPDPLSPYLDAVARQHDLTNRPSIQAAPPSGWCSWYQFSSSQYTGTITPQDLERNIEVLKGIQPDLPMRIFQIDDGFEVKTGDWFTFAPAFPNGVAGLAARARQAGLIPGLWLAPFILHAKSSVASEHPDWLLRGSFSRPANAGYFWNSFATALDLTHPDALAYACEVVRRAVHEWGFDYLKLDFLYAAALPGRRRDPTRTRAQVLHAGLTALREAAGEGATLLGCGCPLGPAIGLVDAMRIGTDTHSTWYPEINNFQAFIGDEPNLPAVRNACQNALTRASLHRRWWINDPDCLLLRRETSLTDAEVHTAATVIAMTGGSFLLSDDLALLPPDRLRIAETILPLIGEQPRILDWFDAQTPSMLRLDLKAAVGSWHLLAIFNWDDEPRDATVNLREFGLDPEEIFLVSEYWSQKSQRIRRGKLLREKIPAHGTLLYAVRTYDELSPAYLGSDLHISQGLEISRWKSSPNGLDLSLQRPGKSQGRLALRLPAPPKQAIFDGQPLQWETAQDGIYHFTVEFQRTASLSLGW